EVESRRRPDAARAWKLLMRAASPPAHLQERLHDHRILDLTSLTMRLPRLVRRHRRPWAITATTLATAGAITAALVLFGPWSPGGHNDGGGGRTGTTDGKGVATGPAGTMGVARTADPCKLLDAASLSRFGATELDPDYGEIDRCDVLVHNGS